MTDKLNNLAEREAVELADKLEQKALRELRAVAASILGASTYGEHVAFAECCFRLADRLRTLKGTTDV